MKRSQSNLLRRGFTLLEMMIVIMIIGILSTFLVVSAPGWIDKANMTGSEANMKRIYATLLEYQSNHSGSWPRETGQRFFLKPWKDGMVEKVEQQAKMYFSPSEPFGDIIYAQGMEEDEIGIVEYLEDWDAIGPGYTSYAGYDHGGDRDMLSRLKKNPGSTAIISDAHMIHRTALLYMTADGAPHRMLRADMEEELGISFDDGDDVEVGPGCGIEILETVSNN
ncbi:MAG: prepilin-type N-terminal cleavage/methylation domain-containing protein [Planctomycetota bacterium]